MVIVFDKETREILRNSGTNSAFPEGKGLEIKYNKEAEFLLRLHDKSKLAQKILKLKRKAYFTEDLTDIIEDEETEDEKQSKIKSKLKKELKDIDEEIINSIPDILPLLELLGLELTSKQKALLERRTEIRGSL